MWSLGRRKDKQSIQDLHPQWVTQKRRGIQACASSLRNKGFSPILGTLTLKSSTKNTSLLGLKTSRAYQRAVETETPDLKSMPPTHLLPVPVQKERIENTSWSGVAFPGLLQHTSHPALGCCSSLACSSTGPNQVQITTVPGRS